MGDVELLAAAVWADPMERSGWAMLVDELLARGFPPALAVAEVSQLVFDAPTNRARRMAFALGEVFRDSTQGVNLRNECRELADARPNARIVVVEGWRPPTLMGRAGHHVFADSGRRCRSAASALRRGFALEYVRSTLCVAVGSDWICHRLYTPVDALFPDRYNPLRPVG